MKPQEYKQFLFNPKADNFLLLEMLKREGDYEKIKKIYKAIQDHPFVRSMLRQGVMPKTLADMRKGKAIPLSRNIIGELSWYLLVFEEFSKQISEFISKKSDFDLQLMLGNYGEAQSRLSEIEAITGKSVWLIESQLILIENRDGLKPLWNAVSEYSNDIKDPVILFFVENISKKAESKISFFRYCNIFQNQVNDSIFDRHVLEYLFFRLNHPGIAQYSHYANMFYIESTSSLVDRFVLFKDIICELCELESVELRVKLIPILERLHSLFPADATFIQILSTIDNKYLNKLESNEDLDELMLLYTSCNYVECISKAKNLLQTKPITLEYIEIAVKSLIENRESTPDLLLNPSLSDITKNVVKVLFNIYSYNGNFENSIDAGYKIVTTYWASPWAKQLSSLIKAATDHKAKNLFTVQYVFNSSCLNARIFNYMPRTNMSVALNDLAEKLNFSFITRLFTAIIEGDNAYIDSIDVLNNEKKSLYIGRCFVNKEEWEIAKDHYENIKNLPDCSSLFREEVVFNLYKCYLNLKLTKPACLLIVAQYLENKQIIKRLDIDALLSLLNVDRIAELGSFIELPIFFRLASNDYYEQYVAYDTYLESLGVRRPSEILEELHSVEKSGLFFLKEVCTIEVMHHSYHFDGSDDIENERLLILTKLLIEDKHNEDAYIKEITELNQSINIRKAIREVNKGRITVNIKQLKTSEIPNVREAFIRLKEIEIYSKTLNIVGIDTSSDLLTELTKTISEEVTASNIVYTSDPAFISFKVIFIEMRDKFILSKEYGLDGYLSTRIRHGTLLNHIRSVFESQNIISQRDKENSYMDNTYWLDIMPPQIFDLYQKIQLSIKKFSKSIDELTEYIVKELIQIKTEKQIKKPHALFDFSISNQELAQLFTISRDNIKDYNNFLDFIFEYLQRLTEKLLSIIRGVINEEIKSKYNVILQDFNKEIKSVLGTNAFPELTSAINLCGTNLQNELRSISEWFYLSNSGQDLLLSVKVLIQTAIQITNTIYPNSQISPKVTDETEQPITGTIHIIYICKILLDNIIIHSKLPSSELDIQISYGTVDGYLQLTFRNNISDEINHDELVNTLDLAKSKWDKSSSDFDNINVEGGSGFDKIRRIVSFDLGCEKYKFDYLITESNLEVMLFLDYIKINQQEYAKSN